MRIDKFISNLWYWSRKQVISYIKDWLIRINSEVIFQKDYEINYWDIVWIWEEEIEHKEFIHIILNKPSWYLSSKRVEWWYKSYMELLENSPYSNIVNPVWRLDQDTEGLLLLTNSWDLTHSLISPKKDIYKKYYVEIESDLSEKDINKLESWIKLDTDYITKKSKLDKISEKSFYLSISEGKFHQIKKMLEAVWNKVVYLKRVSIWDIELGELKIWEWKYIDLS